MAIHCCTCYYQNHLRPGKQTHSKKKKILSDVENNAGKIAITHDNQILLFHQCSLSPSSLKSDVYYYCRISRTPFQKRRKLDYLKFNIKKQSSTDKNVEKEKEII